MIAKNSTLPANNLLNDAEYVAAATGDLVASILFAIVSIIAFIVAMGNKERSWVYAFSIVFALFLYYVISYSVRLSNMKKISSNMKNINM